jgi:hypothetical protein
LVVILRRDAQRKADSQNKHENYLFKALHLILTFSFLCTHRGRRKVRRSFLGNHGATDGSMTLVAP